MQYLIVGNGRLARHLKHYLNLLNMNVSTWARSESEKKNEDPLWQSELLKKLVQNADRVLLAISDSDIESFVLHHNLRDSSQLVHFSGAHSFRFARGAHPLNTFGQELYSKEVYLNTPFILDQKGVELKDHLPGLPNPYFYLPPEKKALYHCLCVMAGNFSTILWQNTIEFFSSDFKIPPSALAPFMTQIQKNLIINSTEALTGPIARGDINTIIQNLDALRGRPEQKIYYAFLNFVLEKKNKLGDLGYERLNI